MSEPTSAPGDRASVRSAAGVAEETVRAYDLDAVAYAEASPAVPDSVRADLEAFAAPAGAGRAGAGDRIGRRPRRPAAGGPGPARAAYGHHPGLRRAAARAGPRVRPPRPARRRPLLARRAHDAVWANASLLHVERHDLPTVLARLAAVTRPGGILRMSLKEGDGDGWSTHGSVRQPRHFTYWRAGRGARGGAGGGLDRRADRVRAGRASARSRGSRCRPSVIGCPHEAHRVLGACSTMPWAAAIRAAGQS